eukprot:ctg_1255.g478
MTGGWHEEEDGVRAIQVQYAQVAQKTLLHSPDTRTLHDASRPRPPLFTASYALSLARSLSPLHRLVYCGVLRRAFRLSDTPPTVLGALEPRPGWEARVRASSGASRRHSATALTLVAVRDAHGMAISVSIARLSGARARVRRGHDRADVRGDAGSPAGAVRRAMAAGVALGAFLGACEPHLHVVQVDAGAVPRYGRVGRGARGRLAAPARDGRQGHVRLVHRYARVSDQGGAVSGDAGGFPAGAVYPPAVQAARRGGADLVGGGAAGDHAGAGHCAHVGLFPGV